MMPQSTGLVLPFFLGRQTAAYSSRGTKTPNWPFLFLVQNGPNFTNNRDIFSQSNWIDWLSINSVEEYSVCHCLRDDAAEHVEECFQMTLVSNCKLSQVKKTDTDQKTDV